MHWKIHPPRPSRLPSGNLLCLGLQNPCFGKSLDPRGAYFPIHPSSQQCIITMPSNLQSASCICNIECTNIHTKGPKSSIGKTVVTSVIEIGSGSCSVVFTRLHDQWRLESRKVRDPDRDPSQGNSFPNYSKIRIILQIHFQWGSFQTPKTVLPGLQKIYGLLILGTVNNVS